MQKAKSGLNCCNFTEFEYFCFMLFWCSISEILCKLYYLCNL